MRFLRRAQVPDSERVPARNETEAEQRFTRAMNEALGYVTRHTIWRAARPRGKGPWTLLLPDDVVPLPRRDPDGIPWYLWAYVNFEFEADSRPSHEGGLKVVTREYIYSLRIGADQEGEIFCWHWHPADPVAKSPHAHVRAKHEEVPGLDEMHVPTSRVFLEDVLLFAVRNLGVTCREGGESNLEALRNKTGRYATWT